MSERPISLAFSALADMAIVLGAAPLTKYVGCWEHQIDAQWWVAVNGHPTPTKCSKGPEVPAFCAYLEFNGWPAGELSPFGGVIAAGAIANEDALIAAIKAVTT